MNQIEQKVGKYIQRNHLLKHDGRYIVALSGGADSVALLLIMKALSMNGHSGKNGFSGMTLSAAHCNFHLRGEESERDEQFCVDLCQKLGVPLSRIHFDTLAYAHLHKVSVEMAARDLRYRYFAQLAKDIEADGICVAHHRDDNVETLLLNLLRGSGIDGLAGIAPKNGNILRPLLCISREDILQYLQEKEQDYVTDSTNLEDDALRNKIRHHVIPLLESINPAARKNIDLSAKYVRQACLMLKEKEPSEEKNSSEKKKSSEENESQDFSDERIQPYPIYIDKEEIMGAASPEFVLHQKIGKFGFHGDCIYEIGHSMQGHDGGTGKMWKNDKFMLVIANDKLIITSLQQLEKCQEERILHFPEEGNYGIPCLNLKFNPSQPQGQEMKIHLRRYAMSEHFKPSRESLRITLDADKVSFPLTYRRTQQGDRFRPFGMKGSKLVSDYLTDRKRNYLEKLGQHALTDKQGEIIWLVGERTSETTKITENTKNVLEIEITD